LFALIIIILCALVFLIAGALGLFNKDETFSRTSAGLVAIGAIIVAVIIFFIGSIIIVPNGHAGVMVRFQKTTGIIYENGMHFKSLIDTPVTMSIKTQLFEDEATAASKDLQDVSTKIAINYKLDFKEAAVVYQTIGREYIAVIANPVVQETVKEITAKYNAEDMILKRTEVKADITKALVERLALRGIMVESVNIINFDFSDEFTKAIESKVVAVQAVLESENKLRQIEVEARQAEQKAKGEAAAAIAYADGQAKANAILSGSLTPDLLQYMLIQAIKGNDKIIAIPNGLSLTLPTP
jgi:prohibitin 2